MARLKNISGVPLDLYAKTGEADSYRVGPGETVEVPGDVVHAKDEGADFFTIGEGDDARVWPLASWEVLGETARSRGSGRKADEKNDEE